MQLAEMASDEEYLPASLSPIEEGSLNLPNDENVSDDEYANEDEEVSFSDESHLTESSRLVHAKDRKREAELLVQTQTNKLEILRRQLASLQKHEQVKATKVGNLIALQQQKCEKAEAKAKWIQDTATELEWLTYRNSLKRYKNYKRRERQAKQKFDDRRQEAQMQKEESDVLNSIRKKQEAEYLEKARQHVMDSKEKDLATVQRLEREAQARADAVQAMRAQKSENKALRASQELERLEKVRQRREEMNPTSQSAHVQEERMRKAAQAREVHREEQEALLEERRLNEQSSVERREAVARKSAVSIRRQKNELTLEVKRLEASQRYEGEVQDLYKSEQSAIKKLNQMHQVESELEAALAQHHDALRQSTSRIQELTGTAAIADNADEVKERKQKQLSMQLETKRRLEAAEARKQALLSEEKAGASEEDGSWQWKDGKHQWVAKEVKRAPTPTRPSSRSSTPTRSSISVPSPKPAPKPLPAGPAFGSSTPRQGTPTRAASPGPGSFHHNISTNSGKGTTFAPSRGTSPHRPASGGGSRAGSRSSSPCPMTSSTDSTTKAARPASPRPSFGSGRRAASPGAPRSRGTSPNRGPPLGGSAAFGSSTPRPTSPTPNKLKTPVSVSKATPRSRPLPEVGHHTPREAGHHTPREAVHTPTLLSSTLSSTPSTATKSSGAVSFAKFKQASGANRAGIDAARNSHKKCVPFGSTSRKVVSPTSSPPINKAQTEQATPAESSPDPEVSKTPTMATPHAEHPVTSGPMEMSALTTPDPHGEEDTVRMSDEHPLAGIEAAARREELSGQDLLTPPPASFTETAAAEDTSPSHAAEEDMDMAKQTIDEMDTQDTSRRTSREENNDDGTFQSHQDQLNGFDQAETSIGEDYVGSKEAGSVDATGGDLIDGSKARSAPNADAAVDREETNLMDFADTTLATRRSVHKHEFVDEGHRDDIVSAEAVVAAVGIEEEEQAPADAERDDASEMQEADVAFGEETTRDVSGESPPTSDAASSAAERSEVASQSFGTSPADQDPFGSLPNPTSNPFDLPPAVATSPFGSMPSNTPHSTAPDTTSALDIETFSLKDPSPKGYDADARTPENLTNTFEEIAPMPVARDVDWNDTGIWGALPTEAESTDLTSESPQKVVHVSSGRAPASESEEFYSVADDTASVETSSVYHDVGAVSANTTEKEEVASNGLDDRARDLIGNTLGQDFETEDFEIQACGTIKFQDPTVHEQYEAAVRNVDGVVVEEKIPEEEQVSEEIGEEVQVEDTDDAPSPEMQWQPMAKESLSPVEDIQMTPSAPLTDLDDLDAMVSEVFGEEDVGAVGDAQEGVSFGNNEDDRPLVLDE